MQMKAHMFHGGRCWLSDPDHPNYLAGSRATKMVYGVEPDLTREGGSIPVTLTLQEATGKNVILLPMGAADDGAHSQNEKIDIRSVPIHYCYPLCRIFGPQHTGNS
jgi:nonspecific dipeptidase